MKKLLLIAIVVLSSCTKPGPTKQLEHLAGHWEIQKATFTNGTEKKYTLNMAIDYYEVTNLKGVKKKLARNLDGSFQTNSTAIPFELKVEDDSLRIYYKTPHRNWKETILKIKDSTLVLLNDDQKIFTYKKM